MPSIDWSSDGFPSDLRATPASAALRPTPGRPPNSSTSNRAREDSRMTFFKLLAAAGLSALLAGPALAQERISIGTGGTGGLFYVIGAGMADVLNQKMPGTTARAEVTGASVENIRRVAADQMTFDFSSSSPLYEASVGEGPFEEALPVAAIA